MGWMGVKNSAQDYYKVYPHSTGHTLSSVYLSE